MPHTVVLGLGNLLLGDDGVGVHAARALAEAGTSEALTVLDVGVALLEALPAIEQADRLIVLDAMRAGGPPGSIYRLPVEDLLSNRRLASLHGFDLPRLLALAERDTRIEVVVFGVEPASIRWSLELSPPVAEALPKLLEAVRREAPENFLLRPETDKPTEGYPAACPTPAPG